MVDVDKRANDNDADLPAGFKMTELGPLPEEWKVVKLGEIGEVTAGGSAPQERYYFNGRHPFVRVQHLDEDGYWVRRWDLITDEAVQAYRLRFFPKGTIVLPKSGASIRLEKRAVLPVDAYIVSHLCAVIPNSKAVDQRYLFYALKVRKFSSEKVEGYPTLNLSEIRNALIPLPPLSEQRAIAHVLRTVQRAKEATVQVIQATREMKKSLMRHLFTYGPVPVEEAERVPLKETEIGLVPEHWEVVKLENCLSLIRNGISKKQNATSKTGYPVTRIETISEDRINPDKVGYIDNLTPTEVEKFRLRPGDILFSHINSEPQIGRSVIYEGWPSTLLHGMNLLLLRTNSNTIPYWLNYLFMHYRAIGIFIKIAARAVNQSSINQSKMKSLPIPLPPLPEQHEIARILQAVDKKLQAEEARKQALEALLKTLLNNLMTGKIRVKDVVLPNVGEGKGDVTH